MTPDPSRAPSLAAAPRRRRTRRLLRLSDGQPARQQNKAQQERARFSLARAYLLLPVAHCLAQKSPRGLACRRRLRKLGHPEEITPIGARRGQVRNLEADGHEALRASLDGRDGLVLVAVGAGDKNAPTAGRRARVTYSILMKIIGRFGVGCFRRAKVWCQPSLVTLLRG